MNLKLESLTLNLEQYGEEKGQYKGFVRFVGQYGAMEVRLDSKLSQGCLEVCADALVVHSKQVAQSMTSAVIEHASPKALTAE